MHASWRYVTSLAVPTGYRLDLIVFSDERWLRELSALCQPIDLETARADGYAQLLRGGSSSSTDSSAPPVSNASTCWVVSYPRPPASVWHNYPFVSSLHFLADDRVGELLTTVYGYAMKTDWDCFITPTLIQHFPYRLEVGRMHYTPLPATPARLQRVAAGLGLRHRGLHDIGPTWYGAARDLVAACNATLPLVHHLLNAEFETNADGSWRQNWAQGEGWPLWSKDMAIMYAADILFNHLVDEFDISDKYDVHGDTEKYTFMLYHIHSQHDDKDFSKFQFFRHRYQDRDITTGLDFNLVKDYTLWLAVSTWRQVMGRQGAAGHSAGRCIDGPATVGGGPLGQPLAQLSGEL